METIVTILYFQLLSENLSNDTTSSQDSEKTFWLNSSVCFAVNVTTVKVCRTLMKNV